MHKEVDNEGYEAFLNEQKLTDSYDDIVNLADDLFIAFGFAEKRLENK